MKWWLWLIILCVVVSGVAIGFRLTGNRTAGTPANPCPDGQNILTTSPMQLADIDSIIPLGNFAPPGHVIPTTHMYWRYHLKDGVTQQTTIYSPAEMTMTKIVKFDNGGSKTPFDSYRLDFEVCDEVKGYFFHVVDLSDALKAVFHEPFDNAQTSDVGTGTLDHSFEKRVSVALAAGDIIGTAGGNPIYPDALDIGLADSRTTPAIIANPDRWPGSEQHFVCPLDYFDTVTKTQLYSLLGGYKGPDASIDEPRCGEIYQDKPGTAQGVWVAKDLAPTDLWNINKQLTLGHSNYNHKQAIFSFGNQFKEIGLATNSIYGFNPLSTGLVNRDFDDITSDGQTYCFEIKSAGGQTNPNTTVTVQLTDPNTLRLGKLERTTCGSGPWTTEKYLEYVR